MLSRFLGPLALRTVAAYVRNTPIDRGRWRAEFLAIRLARLYGRHISGPVTVSTRFGFRMKLDLSDWVDQHLYAAGVYEPEVAAVVEALLHENDTAVDIGANVGFFSLLFGQCVGSGGKVIAFEPQPGVFERLNANVALNPVLPVKVERLAVSDAAGVLRFYPGDRSHSGVGSLRPRESEGDAVLVESVRLDDLLSPDLPVHLIKVDVEGAEMRVVNGMKRTIRRYSPHVIVEVSDQFLRESNSSGRELCESLLATGYQMYIIEWGGLRKVDGWKEWFPMQFNALFTKSGDRCLADMVKACS
jgi:FkbM family methyltransferase